MLKRLLLPAFFLGGAAMSQDADACLQADPNGQPQATVAACNAFLAAHDSEELEVAQALLSLGVAHRELGNLIESIAFLKRSIEIVPDSSAMRMLAWTYREADDPAKAEDLYTRVLAVDDHWQGYLSRCVVRQDMQNYEAAVLDCQAALAQTPDNLDVLYFTARALNFLGDGSAALPHARAASAAAPDDPRHQVELAWALYQAGQPEPAGVVARRALADYPGNWELQDFFKTTGLPQE